MKKEECLYSAVGGSARMSGSCDRHTSAAKSQADQRECWLEGGMRGTETGVQLTERRRRSARMKLRKIDATSRSWRNKRWNRSGGRRFQAMVSVMAVKIQFNSPSTLFRLFNCPGILSMSSWSIWRRGDFRVQNQRRAILMGVVRHEVKTSAGSSGLWGKISPWEQAARMMRSSSRCCWLTNTPALLQSKTKIEGLLSHVCKSYTERGMYWVKFLLKTQISLLLVGLGTPCPL
mmetsp:Transcript_16857/g.33783  ORF Transcript_16857/g.33783 Transcript_16857/m.33783 type:complete len:233 (-) Transcript_16857:644-1342(-)